MPAVAGYRRRREEADMPLPKPHALNFADYAVQHLGVEATPQTNWVNIAAAFVHRDANGIDIKLVVPPINGRPCCP